MYLFLNRLDKNEIFAKPVSIEEVPDYLIHIKHPMDFGTMRKKIDAHEYSLGGGMQEFKVLFLTISLGNFYKYIYFFYLSNNYFN